MHFHIGKNLWKNKKNDKDFLLIKFEDLVTDTEMAITSMFKFLNIIFDQELLIKSIELNQKKNHIKYMDNKIDNTIRFSSSTNKELIDLIKLNQKIKFLLLCIRMNYILVIGSKPDSILPNLEVKKFTLLMEQQKEEEFIKKNF